MHDVLRSALGPVLRDLQDAGIFPASIADDEEWANDVHSCRAMLWSADGTGSGVHVSRSDSQVERVAAVADQVQEWAVEELWSSSRSTTWPECPRHPKSHPMQAAVHRGGAWWVCPRGRAPVVRIGALAG